MNSPDLFFGTRGPHDAEILCVGEAWGEQEEAQRVPFIGGAGMVLEKILSDGGLDPKKILYTNLVNARPKGNDFKEFLLPGRGSVGGLNPTPALIEGVSRLYSLLSAVRPKLILACGNYPLWALTNVTRIDKGVDKPKDGKSPIPDVPVGIGDFHGSQLYALEHRINNPVPDGTTSVLPLFHPAYIMRDWSSRWLTVHDVKMRAELALRGEWKAPGRVYLAPPTYGQVISHISHWLNTKEKLSLSLDLETRWNNHIITCIGLSDQANWGMSVPFVRIRGKDELISYWTRKEERTIWKLLDALFRHPLIYFIGQNLNFDMQIIWHTMRARPKISFDTLIAQHLLIPGTPKDLGTLSGIYCAHHRYWKDDNKEWSSEGSLETHLYYNCEDVDRTLQIAKEQVEVLTHVDKMRHFPFELKKLELAREMNRRGMLRDKNNLAEAAGRILSQMNNFAAILSRLVPQSWIPTKAKTPWYRSDKQIKYVLYELCALPVQMHRKTGKPASDKEALNSLAELFPRLSLLFNLILDYGSLDTIYTTFIQGRAEYDGRIHASFNPTGAETFRWSSSANAFSRAHNMQNIPVGGEDEDAV